MNNTHDRGLLPELKQIVGALLFGSKTPLGVAEIRKVLQQTAEIWGEHTRQYAEASNEDIAIAVSQLRADLAERKTGMRIQEVAGGYRLENDPACGPWLRQLLARGKPTRLSRPALETLAIIAYRQPCMRSEIEAVRGVAVDQILRNLLEMQLIRIVGRSPLPGRPWLFGTTQKFLEHFGLKSLDELPGIEELRRMETDKEERTQEERVRAGELANEMSSREITGNDAQQGDALQDNATVEKPGERQESAEGSEAESEDNEYDEDEFDELDDEFDEDEFDEGDHEEDDADEMESDRSDAP